MPADHGSAGPRQPLYRQEVTFGRSGVASTVQKPPSGLKRDVIIVAKGVRMSRRLLNCCRTLPHLSIERLGAPRVENLKDLSDNFGTVTPQPTLFPGVGS